MLRSVPNQAKDRRINPDYIIATEVDDIRRRCPVEGWEDCYQVTIYMINDKSFVATFHDKANMESFLNSLSNPLKK